VPLWVVVGLGNPGRRYAGTRHNVGFSVIQRLARRWGAEIRRRKYGAKVAEVTRNEERLVLALPQTYMNLSGVAVRQISEAYRVAPARIVVVSDDLDIPLGQIRVRKSGSAGTHKGLRSIVAEMGTPSIPRLRIGIGPLTENEEAVEFVLSRFSREELPVVEEALAKAEEALEMILAGRIEAAMNRFNQRGMT
jgi:PTH1 family peptidyl-tRNA hydrolase